MISRIRIGGVDWAVELVDGLVESANAFGLMCQASQTLKIQSGMPAPLTRQALLHEILHVLWRQAALGESCKEERAVEAIGNALHAVFADNPSLLVWFLTKGV